MSRIADNVVDVWYNTLHSSTDQASKICLRSVEFPDNSYTYAEVDALSNQVAHWALSKGLKPRDVVALFMENRPAYIITWLGLAKIGVTSAWINSNNKMKPLIHSITICKAKLFLFGNELKNQVEPVLSTIRDMGIALYDCGGPGGSPADSTFARSVLFFFFFKSYFPCSEISTLTHTPYISFPKSVHASLAQHRLSFVKLEVN